MQAWLCEIFRNTFLHRTSLVAASEHYKNFEVDPPKGTIFLQLFRSANVGYWNLNYFVCIFKDFTVATFVTFLVDASVFKRYPQNFCQVDQYLQHYWLYHANVLLPTFFFKKIGKTIFLYFRSSHSKNSQNLEENNCAGVSVLIQLPVTLWKKKLWHKCFRFANRLI